MCFCSNSFPPLIPCLRQQFTGRQAHDHHHHHLLTNKQRSFLLASTEAMDHDGDIPMPINSSYGVHNHHDPPHMPILHAASSLVVPPPCPPPPPPPPSSNGNGYDKKVASHHHVVRYKECLKNHAASMGGNATDGCGEFMPSGEEGTIEALTCSACNCHRNFHRKEIQGDPPLPDHFYQHYRLGRSKLIHLAGGGHHHKTTTSNMLLPPPPEAFGYSRAGGGISSHGGQMVMSYNMQQQVSACSGDDDREEEGEEHRKMKKRFRTKFTQEQKEKMLKFAERVGWKIQKQEEGVVQQLCQELGIKRRVLKVWMHNNKHTYNKNNNSAGTAAAATTTDHHHHHAQQLI